MIMAELRIAVVDDEPLVRRGLRAFLAEERDVAVVGEAASGYEAVQLITNARPDLVFLDVQMPELNGFDVVASIEENILPEIVFVTAYDEYALRAFDVHAVDYLMKPFDIMRFRLALRRARFRIESGTRQDGRGIDTLLADARRTRRPERLLVKDGASIVVVSVDEINWIEAADNYVRLHCATGRYLLREAIRSLEQRLDENRFARVHRSAIVNLSRVREMQILFGGEYQITLTTGDRLTLSRSYREAFRDRLVGGGFDTSAAADALIPDR
jgi:two-component system LytT family response regulator